MELQGLVLIVAVVTSKGNCRLRFTLSKLRFPLYMLCAAAEISQDGQVATIGREARAEEWECCSCLLNAVNLMHISEDLHASSA